MIAHKHRRPPTVTYPTHAFLVLAILLVVMTFKAQAQSYLIPDSDRFAATIEHLRAGEIEAAEKELDGLPRAEKDADYHYLRGVIAMQLMDDAGAIRMARLARRMKNHFEDALDNDPDHELAHFGLMQFHRFAPGLMGGRESQLTFHQQRLTELDSFLQFPAALVKAQVEQNQDAEQQIYQDWIAHSPQMFEAHYAYLTGLIEWGNYEQADTLSQTAANLADSQQAQLLQYQQVRMAALAGLSEDSAQAQQYREQPWFAEAYNTGIELLTLDPLADGLDVNWLHMRLAQIEWALQDSDNARTRLEHIQSQQPGERLQEEITALYSKLDLG